MKIKRKKKNTRGRKGRGEQKMSYIGILKKETVQSGEALTWQTKSALMQDRRSGASTLGSYMKYSHLKHQHSIFLLPLFWPSLLGQLTLFGH